MFLTTLSRFRSLVVGWLVGWYVSWYVGLSVSLLDSFVKKLTFRLFNWTKTYLPTYLPTYFCESRESSDNKSQFATKLKNWNCDQQQNLNINSVAKQLYWLFFYDKKICHNFLHPIFKAWALSTLSSCCLLILCKILRVKMTPLPVRCFCLCPCLCPLSLEHFFGFISWLKYFIS